MPKNILNIVIVLVFGMIGGVFADQIFLPYLVKRNLFQNYRTDTNPVYITEQKEIIIQENTAIQDVADKVRMAVVGIKSGTSPVGSALIVSSDGLLVTFSSLIPQSSQAKLFWDGEQRSFQVLKRDVKTNLVLLKMEKLDLPTVGFADTEKIRLGSRAILIGISFDDKENPIEIVNDGIIRSVQGVSIQTNIIDDKNITGSPVFDIEGRVIGLSMVDKTGRVSIFSVNTIREFIGL